MRSLCVKEMCRKPLLMDLTFAELGWRSSRICKGVSLELGHSRSNSHHLRRICLPRLLRLRGITLLLGQGAKLLEFLRLLESEPLVRCRLPSTSSYRWRVVFPHLSTCRARSAVPIRRTSCSCSRTSFAALARSALGTLFTL